jgi:cobalt-zinc-cadmium efflux system protein
VTALPERRSQKARLRGALAVTVGILLVEVAGGVVSGSLALVADAVHMFTDVAALTLAYAAMSMADRAPTGRHTFGLHRAEVLAAFVNAEILLALCGYVLFEAYRRSAEPPEVRTGVMLAVAAAGLVANLVAMRLLRGKREASLNLRAAYLEVFTDTLASVAVLAAALVMSRTRWYLLDALVSGGVALFVLPRAWGLLRQSAHILLEGTPREIDPHALRRRILGVPGVEALHDLHFWTLTSGLHSASVHIRADSESRRGEVLVAVQKVLQDETGIDHATIQVEAGGEAACHSAREHA